MRQRELDLILIRFDQLEQMLTRFLAISRERLRLMTMDATPMSVSSTL